MASNPNPRATLGTVPPEALSGGSINESVPASARDGSHGPEVAEPRRGKNGEYLPASYKIPSGNVRTDR